MFICNNAGKLPLTRNHAHEVPLGNISKEYCCNIDKMCVQEEGSHKCYEPSETKPINFTPKMDSENAIISVTLVVNDEVKDGTIVSFFCIASDCRKTISNVMLLNIEICETINRVAIKQCILI